MSAGSSSYSGQYSVATTGTNTVSGTTATYTLPFGQSFQISEVWGVVTTAVTVADTVITVARNKKAGVATDDVSILTFTVPFTSSAIGDVLRIDCRTMGDTLLCPGESISFTSAGSATAGAVWFGVIGFESRFGNDPYPFQSFTTVAKDRSGTGSIKYLAGTEA